MPGSCTDSLGHSCASEIQGLWLGLFGVVLVAKPAKNQKNLPNLLMAHCTSGSGEHWRVI